MREGQAKGKRACAPHLTPPLLPRCKNAPLWCSGFDSPPLVVSHQPLLRLPCVCAFFVSGDLFVLFYGQRGAAAWL